MIYREESKNGTKKFTQQNREFVKRKETCGQKGVNFKWKKICHVHDNDPTQLWQHDTPQYSLTNRYKHDPQCRARSTLSIESAWQTRVCFLARELCRVGVWLDAATTELKSWDLVPETDWYEWGWRRRRERESGATEISNGCWESPSDLPVHSTVKVGLSCWNDDHIEKVHPILRVGHVMHSVIATTKTFVRNKYPILIFRVLFIIDVW